MRLIFMGTPDFAVPALDALIGQGRSVAAVYTQPPRPAGRGKKLQKSPIHRLAENHGIPVETPVNFKDPADVAHFASYSADIAIVAAYGLILPQSVLDAPAKGCVNIHASILPRWRGAAPIHRAIMAGDRETGVALMQMEAGLDTGPVHALKTVAITPTMTTGMLHDQLATDGADLLLTYLDRIASGDSIASPQSAKGITYAHKIEKVEGIIDWSQGADDIDRLVRALNPFPGAFTYKGGDRLRVHGGLVKPGDQAALPGTLLTDTGLVACGSGAYQISRIQRAGKAAADIDAFLRGFPLDRGTVLAAEPS